MTTHQFSIVGEVQEQETKSRRLSRDFIRIDSMLPYQNEERKYDFSSVAL